ncbi:MAG: hypothetical protein M0R51_09640 [Clostridia bacterium]|jgi:hypothetical protein|nr:hypothetical protein [Clostridia bacterium]
MRLHEIIDQMQGEGYFKILDIKNNEIITALIINNGNFYQLVDDNVCLGYVLDVNDLMYDGWQVIVEEKKVDIVLDEYTVLFSEKLGIDFLIKKIKDSLWLIFDDDCERVMYVKTDNLTLDYLNDVTKQVYEFIIKQEV